MKRFHAFMLCSVLFLGLICGLYAYTKRGVVSERTIHAIQEKCLRLQNFSRIACLRREVGAIVRGTNISSIMHALLMDTYHADDSNTVYNSPNCHAFAHIVGEIAGAQSHTSAPQLFSQCGTGCVYGCVHGMFLGLLKKGMLTASTIATVCDENRVSVDTSRDREECIHGIGHGLADYLYNDIPTAVAYCDNFPSLFDKKTCWEGLFMQVYGPVVSRENIVVLPVDRFTDCRTFPLDVRRICMQSVLSVLGGIVRDIGFATGVCQATLNELDQCIEGIDSLQTIDVVLEQSIQSRCMRAEKVVYSCIDTFVEMTQNETQKEAVCATNGIVHRDECLAYMKKKPSSRSIR